MSELKSTQQTQIKSESQPQQIQFLNQHKFPLDSDNIIKAQYKINDNTLYIVTKSHDYLWKLFVISNQNQNQDNNNINNNNINKQIEQEFKQIIESTKFIDILNCVPEF